MTKIYYSCFCALLISLSGCSKPSALANFNYDKFYANSLQNTLKNDIVTEDGVTAILNATYLNASINSTDKNTHELFLVGVFVTKDEENKKTLKSNYSLTLNGLKPDSIKALDEDNRVYTKIPLYNPWAKYYTVKFNKENLNNSFLKNLTKKQKYTMFEYKKLELKFSINEKESTTLTFQKEI